jgi:8-oxo-dGTP pyrophosphatase MutT (NUDIX family)/DNA-binding XRE family transcriptional regulator
VASLIRQRRQERQLSIGAVARLLGLSEWTVRSWEAGRTSPTKRHARALARLLRVDVTDLGLGSPSPVQLAERLALGHEEGQPTRTVAAVITHKGKILLTQRQPIRGRAAVWSWLGGMIEAGETPEQAIRRELAEELSAAARVLRYLGVAEEREDMSPYWGPRFAHGYEMHLFHVAVPARIEATDIIDHEELAGVDWFTPDEFPAVLDHLPPRLVDAAVRFGRMALESEQDPVLGA